MNAMEKVAWAELIVSAAALAAVAALFPWLGNGATGAFGLLGFCGFAILFLRKKSASVVIDERDREIERRARQQGIHAAWMMSLLCLVGLVLWSSRQEQQVVSASSLTWLLWSQIAVCMLVKGLVGVVSYRRKGLAA
jgi:cytochrome bd-type quinol oxidase subunit 2